MTSRRRLFSDSQSSRRASSSSSGPPKKGDKGEKSFYNEIYSGKGPKTDNLVVSSLEVVVAMSGGVDSSVTALLLSQQVSTNKFQFMIITLSEASYRRSQKSGKARAA